MAGRILYAGDTSITTAGSYMAGILTHYGLPFAYVPSTQPIAPTLAAGEHALYILSDYPVNNVRPADFDAILTAVRGGAGLLMIGGWESFHGLTGEYHNSPLAEALPVVMQASDDRVNCGQPCIVEKLRDHPILAGLPFDRPPTIGGYNRVTAKPDATTVLAARHVEIVARPPSGAGGGEYGFTLGLAYPLLVLGGFGRGRTAAFTSDVAPHWIGSFVDWGASRLTARAAGGEAIEVGSDYAEFFARLVRWAIGNAG